MPDPRPVLRRWRRSLLRHRRPLLAVLGAATVVAFAEQVAPAPPPQTSVVVAAHDLQAGQPIGADDVEVVPMPAEIVPNGAAIRPHQVVGETLAGPMRAGEVVTDRRVVTASLVAGYPAGTVAAPVRVADGDVVALLEVGDTVDVYAADRDPGRPARLLVSGADVVALPSETGSGTSGALVVLAVDRSAAAALAGAAGGAEMSVVLRG
jgi:Flp pilus assembly protein CpaB